jgi:hypothetical protein
MWRFFIIVFGFMVFSANIPARAEDVGRYQAVSVPKAANEFVDRVMILDTKTGDFWLWWESPAVQGSPGGLGITYMGKVTPGSVEGYTHPIQRSNDTAKAKPLCANDCCDNLGL